MVVQESGEISVRRSFFVVWFTCATYLVAGVGVWSYILASYTETTARICFS